MNEIMKHIIKCKRINILAYMIKTLKELFLGLVSHSTAFLNALCISFLFSLVPAAFALEATSDETFSLSSSFLEITRL